MTDQDPNVSALAREWLLTRVTIAGGFAIAIAVAAYFMISAQMNVARQEHAQQSAAEMRAKANAEASLALCSSALTAAKSFGIVPSFGTLASPKLQKTDVQGRYVCLAATSVTKYLLAADLLCRDLRDQRCVSLFSITQDDGTVLYQRHS